LQEAKWCAAMLMTKGPSNVRGAEFPSVPEGIVRVADTTLLSKEPDVGRIENRQNHVERMIGVAWETRMNTVADNQTQPI